MDNQGKLLKEAKPYNKCLSLYFRSDFLFVDERYTADRETHFCCDVEIFIMVKTE